MIIVTKIPSIVCPKCGSAYVFYDANKYECDSCGFGKKQCHNSVIEEVEFLISHRANKESESYEDF